MRLIASDSQLPQGSTTKPPSCTIRRSKREREQEGGGERKRRQSRKAQGDPPGLGTCVRVGLTGWMQTKDCVPRGWLPRQGVAYLECHLLKGLRRDAPASN